MFPWILGTDIWTAYSQYSIMRANIFAGFRRISWRLNGNNKDMGKNTVKIELFCNVLRDRLNLVRLFDIFL